MMSAPRTLALEAASEVESGLGFSASGSCFLEGRGTFGVGVFRVGNVGLVFYFDLYLSVLQGSRLAVRYWFVFGHWLLFA
jgi:hypothetical protein